MKKLLQNLVQKLSQFMSRFSDQSRMVRWISQTPEERLLSLEGRVTKLVLTGGPCGGKTTVLSRLKEEIEQRGYVVLIAPEAATACISGGISPISTFAGVDIAQNGIIDLAYQFDRIFTEAAIGINKKTGKEVVIIFDRHPHDSSAYTPAELYQEILQDIEPGLTSGLAKHHMSHAIFHLQTAAHGAEKAFSNETNEVRYEDLDDARLRDDELVESYLGHPHTRKFENEGYGADYFERKVQGVVNEALAFLGEPVPIEKERKFLVKFDPEKMPQARAQIVVEQTYIAAQNDDDGAEARIRSWNSDQHPSFSLTEKVPVVGSETNDRYEIQRLISAVDYYKYVKSYALKDHATIKKQRHCFYHDSHLFELDVYEDDVTQLLLNGNAIVEIELANLDTELVFPEWITVINEVTGVGQYSNAEMSRQLHLLQQN